MPAEGVVTSVVDEAKKIGVVLEVNSETDFVAKNPIFNEFVAALAKIVLEQNPADVDALKACVGPDGMTVEKMLQEKVMTIGENIQIRRFVRLEGDLVSYVHGGGKIGVMVKFDTDLGDKEAFKVYGKDVAMQIAAINPSYVRKEDVPADEVAKEKEILIAQAQQDPKNANKPANVLEKMVEGRLNKKFYQDACLLEQPLSRMAISPSASTPRIPRRSLAARLRLFLSSALRRARESRRSRRILRRKLQNSSISKAFVGVGRKYPELSSREHQDREVLVLFFVISRGR